MKYQKKKFFRVVMNVEQRKNLRFRQESVLRLSESVPRCMTTELQRTLVN